MRPDERSTWASAAGEMAARVRAHDWSGTPLGPLERWPQSLRTVVDLLLANGFPMAALWGPQLVQIYNDGYRMLMAGKHPAGLGQPTRDCWPEAWHIDGPIYQQVLAGGTLTFEDKLYRITRRGFPEEAWFTLSYSPLRDESGSVAGVLVTAFETTARPLAERTREDRGSGQQGTNKAAARADAMLRGSEVRLAGIFERALVGLSEIRLDGRFVQANTELCRIVGRSAEELVALTIADVTHPDDVAPSVAAVSRVLESGGHASLEKRYRRPDGTVVWANSSITRLDHTDSSGGPTLLAVTVDLTARREAEAALRESEARFRQFGDASSDMLWIRDARSLAFEYLSPAFERMHGVERAAVMNDPELARWTALIVPEDREQARANLERVRNGERVDQELRIVRPSDGQVRWIRSTDFPLHDASGRVQRIGGIAQDVTDDKVTSRHLRVLVAELQHRTRNLLAVVGSIATELARSVPTVEAFAEQLSARLRALSRVQGLLSRAEAEVVTVGELVRLELEALGNKFVSGRVSVSGPEVVLPRRAVQTLALTLHELATNARKHGALATAPGRIRVAWCTDVDDSGTPCLALEWVESGVERISAGSVPPRRGYGLELIEQALPYELDARTRVAFEPDGIRCTISIPRSDLDKP